MSSFQIQQLLFYIGCALILAGVLLGLGAAYMFKKFDILDIRDDLSGKKRAAGVAKMIEEQASGKGAGKDARAARAKRSQKTLAAGATTGSLGSSGLVGTGDVATSTGSAPVQQQAAPAAAAHEVAAPIPQNEYEDEGTTVMAGDNEDTTILSASDMEKAAAEEAPEQPEETAEREADMVKAAAEEAPEQPEETAEPEAEEVSAEAGEQSEQAETAEEASEVEEAPEMELKPELEPEVEANGGTASADVTTAMRPLAQQDFKIVRRIVLTESAKFVRVERGDIDG